MINMQRKGERIMDYKESIRKMAELVRKANMEESPDVSQIRVVYTPKEYMEAGRKILKEKIESTE